MKINGGQQGDYADVLFGFSLKYPPPTAIDEMELKESLRPVTVNAHEWVNVGNIHSMDLTTPGSHTIYWFGSHRTGKPVEFSSGTMLIDILQLSR